MLSYKKKKIIGKLKINLIRTEIKKYVCMNMYYVLRNKEINNNF